MSYGLLSVLLAGTSDPSADGSGDDSETTADAAGDGTEEAGDTENETGDSDTDTTGTGTGDTETEGAEPPSADDEPDVDGTADGPDPESRETESAESDRGSGDDSDSRDGDMSNQQERNSTETTNETNGDETEVIGGQAAGSRQERARTAVGYDDAAETALDGYRNGDGSEGELGVRVTDVAHVYPSPVENTLAASQARNVSKLVTRSMDEERAGRVADTARKHAAADVPPSAFLASYAPGIEKVVEDAFAALADGADPDTVSDRLMASLRAALVDMQVGVDEFATTEDVAPLESDAYTSAFTLEGLLEAVPYPVFLVDAEHTVLEYNVGASRLLGVADDHREWLGSDCRETVAAATYTDGRRAKTLADKVVMNPRDGDEHWDIERADPDNDYTDQIVYEDTSVSVNKAGKETHIYFLAIPIFDERGGLKGVFELVHDRSEEVRQQKSVEELVQEVTDTLHEIGDGNLSARARYEDEYDVINPALMEVTRDVNQMAETFEQLIERVGTKTEELSESIERATNSAHKISQQATTQHNSLEEVADEMEDFSATMEEVAASSNQVASAAESALEAADEGVESGQDARDVTGEVMEISEDLVETVEALDEYMAEIGEVVEVISDVADQTNMLALNANIEAARAGEAGSGFAVVADEVKTLATETQQHTEDIADRIELIQEQTDETVDEVESSHERIQDAESEIRNALDALETISEAVGEAADGIHEVADANDEQAATVEEVMATIDDVRDRSADVAETTETIVHEAEKQESAVFELSDRVHELSTASDGEGHDVDHDHS